MDVFRGGLELRGVQTEHEADQIAGAIHSEITWMAPATERVWHEIRASVRRGDAAPGLRPLLLLGPPGIGKSHWARLLAEKLSVPNCVIEATNEPASCSWRGQTEI